MLINNKYFLHIAVALLFQSFSLSQGVFDPSVLDGIQRNNVGLLGVGNIDSDELDSLKKIIEEKSELVDIAEEKVKIDSLTLSNLDQNNPPPFMIPEKIIKGNINENKNLTKIQNSINETILQLKSDSIKQHLSNLEKKKSYFGYNTFFGNPQIFQPSVDMPIDPSYTVGPGDEIIVMLWGDTELRNSYMVSRDGYLFIKNVGQVFVNGLDLNKLETKLFKLLKKVYASLDNINGPTTYLDVSLGSSSLRPLRIFALGELRNPGAYVVKPTATIFTALYYFNGPDVEGSMRSIKLIRDEKEIADIDFYDFLLSGKRKNDEKLQRDDIIFIPPRGNSISLRGEINRTNLIYELKDKEGILDLIKMAGGLKSTTFLSRVSIDREVQFRKGENFISEVTRIDLNLGDLLNDSSNFELKNNDIVTFYKTSPKSENVYNIEGSVKRPGMYSLEKNLRVKSAILNADSLLNDTYLKRAEIIREKKGGKKELLSINLERVFLNDPVENISLQTGDILKIYNENDLKFLNDISIRGFVEDPGVKEFYDGMEVFDLVLSGGGFENEERLSKTFLKRADLISRDSSGNISELLNFNLGFVLEGKGIANQKVKRGDEIVIYSKDDIFSSYSENVTVSGFVKRPGAYPISANSTLKSVLLRAGGFEDKADLNKIYTNRADLFRTDFSTNTKRTIKINLNDAFNEDEYKYVLQKGDEIRVYTRTGLLEIGSVEIGGQIKNPGTYQYKDNMTIKDLILEAGFVDSDQSVFRAELSRINKSNYDPSNWASIYTFDFKNDSSLFIEASNDFYLQPTDKVVIRSGLDANHYSVRISGAVVYPGEYFLENSTSSPKDLIERSGGLRPEAYTRSSKLIRDGEEIRISFEKMIRSSRSRTNFFLKPGDEIQIGTYPNVVKVSGEVYNPGVYPYARGKSFSDYVKEAGGYTSDAAKYSSYVTYPDGISVKNKFIKINDVKIYDGSEIIVPKINEENKFSFTEYAVALTSFWVDLSQAWLMITLAVKS